MYIKTVLAKCGRQLTKVWLAWRIVFLMGLPAVFLGSWSLPSFAATITYLSNNIYAVPATGVTMLQIVAKGGGGGGGSTASSGGSGAKVVTYQPVTANEQLTIKIGTGGQSGSGGSAGGTGEGIGGNGVTGAGGGGGSTSVIDGTTVQIIAGGGGGGSSGSHAVSGGSGGTIISTPTQPASCTTPLAPVINLCYPGAEGLAVTDTGGVGASGDYTAGPPSINAGGGNGSDWHSDGTTGSNGNGGDGVGSGGGGGAGAGGGGGGSGIGGGTAAGGAGASRVSTNSFGPTYSGDGGTGGSVNAAGGNGSVIITSLTADTFTWSATPTMTFGGATGTWTATSGNALAVTETSRTPAVCTISGTTITAVAGGTCTIRAATASYVTGEPSGIGGWEDQSLTINKANQTITFGTLSDKTYSDPLFTVSATSDSGLSVAFSSTTTSVCTVSGATVTIVTAGTCTIRASQAGDATYVAASNIDQSFTVAAVVPGAPTIGTATGGDAQATVNFTAPVNNGGAAITIYTATSSPSNITGTCASSPCTVTGLTNGSAYTFTVTATNSAGAGSASAASNSVMPATVPGAPTIGTATAGNAQATVNFTAPVNNGGAAITSYTATSSPSNITGTCALSPCTVTGLTNGSAYTFTVTATNAAGTGAASAASNNVIPAVPNTTPNAFTFVDKSGVTLSSVVTSAPVKITGINVAINWTATGGGTACVSAGNDCSCDVVSHATSGTITNNQYLCVQHTSSASYSTATNTTLAVGGVSDTFTSTTLSTSVSGPSINGSTGAGAASATVTGGGNGAWLFATAGNGALQSGGFIPLSGNPKSPPVAPPAGVTFPYGLLDFVLAGGQPGSTATITITYPAALPPNAVYWKYGPTPGPVAAHWYTIPATIVGNTVTITITDGGIGDHDLTVNSTIADPGGVGLQSQFSGAVPIPALSTWSVIILSILLALGTLFSLRHLRT
ncbi:MAG: Fibronectin type III domain-containing protein [Candidatus Nitrotoga sp. CP45]|nr:MAG: Fibronectin type III domain-containing protein [Candidatus Nitrotoga sp. CP45]